MRQARLWAVVLLGCFALTLGATPSRADESIELKYEEPTPVSRLLDDLRAKAGLPLVWDPKGRAIQGKEITGVTLSGSREEILASARALLAFYELVFIPVGQGKNAKLLVMDARQTAAIVKLKPVYVKLNDGNLHEYEGQDGLFLTTTIRVEHMENLRDARNALNRIVTGQNIGNVTEVPAARSFVVTDFAPNVVAIYRLIREMDVPVGGAGDAGNEVIFQAFPLRHAPAGDTAGTLNAHFGTSEPRRPASGVPPQQAPTLVPPEPVLRIHADDRLNQLLVTGMRKDVDRVAQVVKVVDRPTPRSAATVQVVRLEHVDAGGVMSDLSSLIHQSPSLWTRGPSGTERPTVVSHGADVLLIHASEPALTVLLRLVAELDQSEESPEER